MFPEPLFFWFFFEPNPRLWEFFEVRAFLKTLLQSVRKSGRGHQYQQHLTNLISWASNVQLFLGNACMPFQTMTHLCCKYPFNRVQFFLIVILFKSWLPPLALIKGNDASWTLWVRSESFPSVPSAQMQLRRFGSVITYQNCMRSTSCNVIEICENTKDAKGIWHAAGDRPTQNFWRITATGRHLQFVSFMDTVTVLGTPLPDVHFQRWVEEHRPWRRVWKNHLCGDAWLYEFTKVSQSLVGRTIFQIIKTTVAIDPVRLEVGNGLEPRLFESAGIKQTSSARERNMLNILSYNCSTLRTSRVVIDKSQSTKPLVWFKFTEFDWLQICEFDLSFWIWLIAVLICDRFKFLNLIDCSVWFVSLIWLQCLICEFDLIAAFDLWVFLNLIVTGIARAPCSRCQFREDGSVPTLATRSSTYSMSLGRDLELPELATLMLGVLKLIVSNHSIFCDLWWGSVQCLSFSTHFVCEKRLGNIDSFEILVTQRMGLPPSADFTGQTGPAVQKMIGNGMHVACVGQAVGIGVLVRSGLIWAHVWSLDQCKMGPTELRSLDLCRGKHKETEFGYGADSEIIRLRSISCSVCMSYCQGHILMP